MEFLLAQGSLIGLVSTLGTPVGTRSVLIPYAAAALLDKVVVQRYGCHLKQPPWARHGSREVDKQRQAKGRNIIWAVASLNQGPDLPPSSRPKGGVQTACRPGRRVVTKSF